MYPPSDSPFFQFPQHLYISSSSFGQIQTSNNFINETLFHHHQHQNQILNQIFEDGKQEKDGVPSNLFDGPTKVDLASANMNEYVEKNQYAPLEIIPARLQPPGKKDRHSKIVTAQGPRDRRVRLSIDIAKRFFGLQDMLGYDKASKTLDWLLTKSKMAIEEVAQSKKKNTHMADYALESDPEMMMMAKNQAFAKDFSGQGKMSAKESNRIMARQRARERTRRKKMCIFSEHKQSDHTIITPSTSKSNQSLPMIQKGSCKISDADFDMSCQELSNLCPQISSHEELSQTKKNKFSNTSSMYDGPSINSCPENHLLPCTSTANGDTTTQRVFHLCGQTNWDMKSTNHQL